MSNALSTAATLQDAVEKPAPLRNIGVFAHVDAGKTTITERVLYYTNTIAAMGDVDTGDTSTDFMDQERERGITIQSACVRLKWANTAINLVDTPGHVDFGAEVSRVLRVIDGAVLVLDAAKGVQAQTEAIWRQAGELPRVVFVNKMDREGACFAKSVLSVEKRFPNTRAVPVQVPLFACHGLRVDSCTGKLTAATSGSGGSGVPRKQFCGIVNIIEQKIMYWDLDADVSGRRVLEVPLSDEVADGAISQGGTARLLQERETLIERLVDLDDELGVMYLETYDCDASIVPSSAVYAALRRLTLSNGIVPVLCGAAVRNVGVQPLLDAVVRYLPSPHAYISRGADRSAKESTAAARALVFKIAHDAYRGCVAFVRVLSGTLHNRDLLRRYSLRSSAENMDNGTFSSDSDIPNSKHKKGSNKAAKEVVGRLLQVQASDDKEVENLAAGDIGAIVGLKHVTTGDMLVSALAKAPPHDVDDTFQELAMVTPEPCFSCAIEPDATSQQDVLVRTLEQLSMEDPSLRVVVDKDTGQTILHGMGELHLDIVHTRVVNDFGVPCETGEVRVNFRETLKRPIAHALNYRIRGLGKEGRDITLRVALRMEPLDPMVLERRGGDDDVGVDSGGSSAHKQQGFVGLTHDDGIRVDFGHDIPGAIRDDLAKGVRLGLLRGPMYGCPMMCVMVTVEDVDVVDAAVQGASANSGGSHVEASLGGGGSGSRRASCSTLMSVLQSTPLHQLSGGLCSAATKCVAEALRMFGSEAGSVLEPVCRADLLLRSDFLGDVMADISSKRRGMVESYENGDDVSIDTVCSYARRDASVAAASCMDGMWLHHVVSGWHNEGDSGNQKLRELLPSALYASDSGSHTMATDAYFSVVAVMPLLETLGYASALRSRTQGTGHVQFEVIRYEVMPQSVQVRLDAEKRI